MNKLMQKLSLTIGLLSVVSLGAAFGTPAYAAEQRDCDTNAIIRCGSLTQSELQQDYNTNATGDLEAVFAHYGITEADMQNISSAKMGRIYKDGKVVVDGETVATNARSVGRENIPGSTPVTIDGKTYYERSPSVSFRNESLPAIVIMKDGVFHRAIITSCGNPVVATPATKPEPPKHKTAPAYVCEDLKVTKISRERYQFTTMAEVVGDAKIVEYVYDFGNGETEERINNSVTHDFDTPGTYTAKVTPYVEVDGRKVAVPNTDCTAAVTIEAKPVEPCPYNTALPKNSPDCKKPEQKPQPCPYNKDLPADSPQCEKPEEPVVELPKTGPAQLVGAGLGVSSLTAAGYYWTQSRRNLVSKIINRK